MNANLMCLSCLMFILGLLLLWGASAASAGSILPENKVAGHIDDDRSTQNFIDVPQEFVVCTGGHAFCTVFDRKIIIKPTHQVTQSASSEYF